VEINLTLIVQMLVFAAFVLFTMKLVWPPLSKALEERQDKIADGLSAAERGRKELELAQHRVKDELKQAKVQSADIIEKANKRAVQIVEEAKEVAKHEAQIQLKLAQEQLVQQVNHARDELRKQVVGLAITGAEKILMREVDAKANAALLDNLIEEI
jgi:F-type H+-transporting ATPase subunit b